jgi:protein-S-isoprenylcysteine O-methyltransferase Ste14
MWAWFIASFVVVAGVVLSCVSTHHPVDWRIISSAIGLCGLLAQGIICVIVKPWRTNG